jgi:hypothetical protein
MISNNRINSVTVDHYPTKPGCLFHSDQGIENDGITLRQKDLAALLNPKKDPE